MNTPVRDLKWRSGAGAKGECINSHFREFDGIECISDQNVGAVKKDDKNEKNHYDKKKKKMKKMMKTKKKERKKDGM